MRQSTLVGISCALFALCCVVGSFWWAGPLYGALLLLAIGGLTTTFAIMVDLREREEREAERWPS